MWALIRVSIYTTVHRLMAINTWIVDHLLFPFGETLHYVALESTCRKGLICLIGTLCSSLCVKKYHTIYIIDILRAIAPCMQSIIGKCNSVYRSYWYICECVSVIENKYVNISGQ